MKNEKIIKTLNLQIIVMVLSLIFIVLSFFVKTLADYREIVLGIILLMMGYTNIVVYEKKKLSILYFAFAALLIIPNIIRLVK